MPQLMTRSAQKGKKSRTATASGALKVATPNGAPSKRESKQKGMPAKGMTSDQRRNRRSPMEILQELKDKRDRLHDSMTERLMLLDERIAKLESRHSSKIKVSELLQTHSTEELQTALDSIRKQRSLLRRALKDRLNP